MQGSVSSDPSPIASALLSKFQAGIKSEPGGLARLIMVRIGAGLTWAWGGAYSRKQEEMP